MIPSFYPIIDTAACRSRGVEPLALAAACLRAGARLLQLRGKDETSAELLDLAVALVELARPFAAAVIVNDRADIARMAGAAGVHVGQEDLPVEAVRSIVGAGAIVGLSTHEPWQADAAARTSASYIAVGPVFATATKDTGYSARGIELVAHAARLGRPVVAIGGITAENAPLVYAAGASSVAVIGDLLAGPDVEARARAFVTL